MIDCSSIININRLIDIDCHRLSRSCLNVIEIQEMQSIVFPGFKKVSKEWDRFGNMRDVEFLKVCVPHQERNNNTTRSN